MPCYRVRRRDFEDLLTLHSVQASTLAVSRNDQVYLQLRMDGQHQLEDHDEADTQQTSRFFARTSAGLHALSIILSSQPRGPYNQWRKCTDFFEISMSWPDQDFRHEYR